MAQIDMMAKRVLRGESRPSLLILRAGLFGAAVAAAALSPAVIAAQQPVLAPGRAGTRILIEPNDGVTPIIRALDRAQRSIFVETYLLTNHRIERALERASAQGVVVDVLLEPSPFGMGRQPIHIRQALRAAGIAVEPTPRRFFLTHAKLMVLDDRLAVISTANFSQAGFSGDRDIVVLDRNRVDVDELSNVFRSDWDRLSPRLPDPNLVVSPHGARHAVLDLIAQARRTLSVYAEEVADQGIENAMITAASRGVRVRVLVPTGATPEGVRRLRRGKVRVQELTKPYIHAKMLLVDGTEAMVGSENLSGASLDRNREVGILLRGDVLRRMGRTFKQDWTTAQHTTSTRASAPGTRAFELPAR
ncbi:MAG: phospholipase D-like domain-containing protein [Chloroflexota bacterium]